MRGDPPGVEFFYAAKLIRLEARGVSDYVLDGSCPPVTQLINVGTETVKRPRPSSIGIGLKLQEE
jgi:uncharacterized protein (UPF0303 family)